MMQAISVLGSTGSIGRQTLDVAAKLGTRVVCLAAGQHRDRMEAQCRQFHPRLAVMATREAAAALKLRLGGCAIEIMYGMQGLLAAATLPEAAAIVTAVVGMLGLRPTLAAIDAGKRICLANKETLVCAGELVMARAREKGAEIIPVDSEHSAIFQCLMGQPKNRVRRLLVTCSGGPFYGMTPDELKNVTKHDALCHPNWTMGPKITVDCATLMNKGLELIEAMRLYGLPLSQVEAVIHRQSIVHSLVEFCDGAVLAQLGTPDMRLPIQLALSYPDRLPSPAPDLDLLTCRPLTFDAPDEAAFPCLRLAKQAAAQGGCACAALNGANEAAVALFLEEKIGFYDIPRLVEAALAQAPGTKDPDLEAILAVDAAARQSVAVAARGIVR